MTPDTALTFLHIIASCLGILGFFLALAIWGRCIGFDRRPEDQPPASWLAREGRE